MTDLLTDLRPAAQPTSSTDDHESAIAGLLIDTSAMVGRSMRHLTRNVDALLMAVILPVMMLLLFVYVFGGAMTTDTAYVNYVVPGIILLCASFGSAITAVSVCNDMVNGIIDRFRSLPIMSSAVLTGHVVASVFRNLVAAAVVIGVALLMGFRPTANPAEWVAAVGLLSLFIVAISWVCTALGLLASSADAANGYTFGFLLLPYVSSAFVPTETMPSWLHPFAEHQPVTPMIESVRGLLMGTPIGNSWWLAVLWFGGIAVVAYVAATMLFKRRTSR
jgi:ABC-2 type transport system permease protein